MQRPRPLTLYIFSTGLFCVAVIMYALTQRHIRYVGLPPWYFPFMLSTLVTWAIAMVGLFKMKKWAALLAVVALIAHQFGYLAMGFWHLKHLSILLAAIPVMIYWKKYV